MKLCDACGRHVRESTCPFCGAEITSAALPRARARGSRTARFLGIAAIGVACGGTTTPNDGGTSSDATEDMSPGPMYGAVMPDSGNDASTKKDAASDASDGSDDADETSTALYGAPPPP